MYTYTYIHIHVHTHVHAVYELPIYFRTDKLLERHKAPKSNAEAAWKSWAALWSTFKVTFMPTSGRGLALVQRVVKVKRYNVGT